MQDRELYTKLPVSPLVAKVCRQAAAALERLDVGAAGEVAAERWRQWKDLTEKRPEWTSALSFAAESFARQWASWTHEQRRGVIADLLAPYELSTDSFMRFVQALEARMAG